jgi:hypothetical protein
MNEHYFFKAGTSFQQAIFFRVKKQDTLPQAAGCPAFV